MIAIFHLFTKNVQSLHCTPHCKRFALFRSGKGRRINHGVFRSRSSYSAVFGVVHLPCFLIRSLSAFALVQ
jgi:hypothetical protein